MTVRLIVIVEKNVGVGGETGAVGVGRIDVAVRSIGAMGTTEFDRASRRAARVNLSPAPGRGTRRAGDGAHSRFTRTMSSRKTDVSPSERDVSDAK